MSDRFTVSAAGRALIERNEGLRLDAYPDPATGGDPWTIGYGDTGADVVPGLRITKEEADRRLGNRLANEFGAAVNALIGNAPTTQAQFDAMVSLAYNIGTGDWRRVGHQRHPGGFADSSVLRDHVAGNYAAAADDFLKWNKAAGRELPALTRRRNEERVLYLSQLPAAVDRAAEDSGSVDAAAAPQTPIIIPPARDMQRALAAAGEDPGPVDGVWGPLSAAALRSYYRSRRG